jgi:hypothetical protein
MLVKSFLDMAHKQYTLHKNKPIDDWCKSNQMLGPNATVQAWLYKEIFGPALVNMWKFYVLVFMYQS